MATNWGAIVPLITQGVSTAGQIAAARQAGRTAQAAAQAPVDQINQRAYETDISAKQRGLESKDAALLARAVGMLQEQAAARKAPGERASTSVRGDILANARDATFSGSSRIPKFSFEGGLRPSMFSENTRKLGGEMSRAALMDQLRGERTPFADLPAADFSKVIDAAGSPGATPLPEGSRLDSVLGAISQIGAFAPTAIGAVQAARGTPAAPIPAPQVTPGVPAGLFGNVAPPAPPPVPAPMLAGRNVVGPMANAAPVPGRAY